MGVDTSVTVGYGFAIPEDRWKAFLSTEPEGYEDGDYEVLYAVLKDRPLEGSFGGSYYDDRFNTPVVSVASQYYSEDARDLDGGVRQWRADTITKEELEALRTMGRNFDIDETTFGPFLAVLWH